MGYGIGLAGLASTAEAIDVTSNNIANAQTVGYKSGEYVFSDMYFKAADAQAKDRVGMGSFRQSIRRTSSYGTVVNSQNVLDMAIAGPGMFMLAKDTMGTIPVESPSKFEYTRNGQFATDSQNRIVNENGLLLCGFPADETGNIISGAKSVLTLDQKPLEQRPTSTSTIELNLDNRNATVNTKIFDHTDSTSFSQATSQTVYDQYGTGHILGMYYKKVESQPLTLVDNRAGDLGGFTFQATQKISDPAFFEQARQRDRISTSFNGADAKKQGSLPIPNDVQTIKGGALTHVGSGTGIGSTYDLRMADGTHLALKMKTKAGVTESNIALKGPVDASAGFVAGDTLTLSTQVPPAANPTLNTLVCTADTTIADVKTWITSLSLVGSAMSHASVVKGAATLTNSGALTVENGTFSVAHTTDTYVVEADRYAVYATIDGFPVGHNPDLDANSGTIYLDGDAGSGPEQMSIGTMAFIGGKNIDTLEKGTDGKPIDANASKFEIIAKGGNTQSYGKNNSQGNLGVLQFTVYSDANSALTAQGQTYANNQDGHTVSSLTGYSIDSNGKLIATYDNGESAVKGQLILAYFNNVEGLMPNGNNTFAATEKSGDPLLSFPGDGLMGQVRSKALEQSNVDLTNELVKLMVLQRQYSAMSQATKTMAATIIDDTINIGR